MNLKNLKNPFLASEIEWRVGRCGDSGERVWCSVLCYVTNRAIQDRLDDTVGPENWTNEFKEWRGKGVICGISILIGGKWITKWDGADETDIESTKGGLSDSMKRAAVQWGIGRYLYKLEAGFLDDSHISKSRQAGWKRGKTKKGTDFYWTPPSLPAWALPKANGNAASANGSNGSANKQSNSNGSAPKFDVGEVVRKIQNAKSDRDIDLIKGQLPNWSQIQPKDQQAIVKAVETKKAELVEIPNL